MAEFHAFDDLPEPLRAAIFAAAWRDRAAWWSEHARRRLRLVCRQACCAVDAVIETISVRVRLPQSMNVLEACIQAVGSGRFPALREWRVGHKWSEPVPAADGMIAALAEAIPPTLFQLKVSSVRLDQPAAAALASAAAMPTLRQLILRSTDMDDGALQALLQGCGPCLELLFLRRSRLGLDGATVLGIAAARLPALRELELTQSDLGAAGVEALMQMTWSALEVLNLGGNSVGSEGAAALAAGMARLPVLQHLDLGYNHLGDGGIAVLLQRPWPRLQQLDLGNNDIGREGAAALATSAASHLPALRELDLCGNHLGSAGVRALVKAPWRLLEGLGLRNSGIRLQGARGLARVSVARLPALRRLWLGDNSELGDASVAALAQHPWPHLQELDLHDSSIGVQGAASLAAGVHNFPELTNLLLYSNFELGADGIRALLQLAPWASLRTLDLDSTLLDVEGMAVLAAAAHSQLPALRELILGEHELYYKHVVALAEGDWRNLEVLQYDASWNDYDDAMPGHLSGVEALAAAGAARFPALRRLAVDGSNMPEDQRAALLAAWPDGLILD